MNNSLKKPKVPLSPYNLFFQLARKRILDGTDEVNLPITLPELVEVAAQHKLKRGKKRAHRKTHGKIGFADLARAVSARWKALTPSERSVVEYQAKIEKVKYEKAMNVWNLENKQNQKEDHVGAMMGDCWGSPPEQKQSPFPSPKNPSSQWSVMDLLEPTPFRDGSQLLPSPHDDQHVVFDGIAGSSLNSLVLDSMGVPSSIFSYSIPAVVENNNDVVVAAIHDDAPRDPSQDFSPIEEEGVALLRHERSADNREGEDSTHDTVWHPDENMDGWVSNNDAEEEAFHG